MNPVKSYKIFKQMKTNLKCQRFWFKEIFSDEREGLIKC